MSEIHLILNEREAAKAKRGVARITEILSGNGALELAKAGFSGAAIEQFRRTVEAHEKRLKAGLTAYQSLKAGSDVELITRLARDPGSALILARIYRGLTQADLAKELGLKEQQIQRYEADRYRSISLANFQKTADALGVTLSPIVSDSDSVRAAAADAGPTADQISKIIGHAKRYKWPLAARLAKADRAHASATIAKFLSRTNLLDAALLRTGMKDVKLRGHPLLQAWHTRVSEKARAALRKVEGFDPLDIVWLNELVKLSSAPDGPRSARELLRSKGVALVVEPQIVGLPLDGSAFLEDGVPVIAMTARFDRLDNFWFTLFHELAHIHLHFYSGLRAGFFDDLEVGSSETFEQEANQFAESVLVPPERWRVAPARISKSAEPIERFAQQLGIHPAIVFGRIRKERRDFTIFNDKLGRGGVRCWFPEAYEDTDL